MNEPLDTGLFFTTNTFSSALYNSYLYERLHDMATTYIQTQHYNKETDEILIDNLCENVIQYVTKKSTNELFRHNLIKAFQDCKVDDTIQQIFRHCAISFASAIIDENLVEQIGAQIHAENTPSKIQSIETLKKHIKACTTYSSDLGFSTTWMTTSALLDDIANIEKEIEEITKQ